MRVVLDTNILLDVALNRPGLAEESSAVLDWCETHPQESAIAWHSLADAWYFLAKAGTPAQARKFLDGLLRFVVVVGGATPEAQRSLALPLADFEDALVAVAAEAAGAGSIVTRNGADFRRSPVHAV